MSNKIYNILKYVSMIVLPAIATLYVTVSTLWGWNYTEQIVGTLTAVDLFLGTTLQISNIKYLKGGK